MSNQIPPPSKTIDPYHYYQLVLNPNGTLTRLFDDPHTLPSSINTTILTKDVTINKSNNTWVRLFLPQKATLPNNQGSDQLGTTTNYSNCNNYIKLPLIVFFHGSGFIILSAASTMYHDFCVQMADTLNAVVASVEYRLAPEHRLPAAYDDGVEALHWIRTTQDEWLTQYVDYSNCYLMGNSAGATIAYHVGLRVVDEVDDLEPLKIQGLILRQPFFGGTNRTESELRLENDLAIPLCVCDMMWDLALPIGVDRDHEYCNLTAGNGASEKLGKMREVGWKVLVSGNGGDPLVDRQKELAQVMQEKGVEVVKDFQEEGCHGEELEPSKAKQFIGVVKGFISSFSA